MSFYWSLNNSYIIILTISSGVRTIPNIPSELLSHNVNS